VLRPAAFLAGASHPPRVHCRSGNEAVDSGCSDGRFKVVTGSVPDHGSARSPNAVIQLLVVAAVASHAQRARRHEQRQRHRRCEGERTPEETDHVSQEYDALSAMKSLAGSIVVSFAP
jgi:hypothetical protein